MNDNNRASVALIGVGNSALSDEGVASRVIHEVARKAPPGIDVVDAGLPGPGLIDLVEGRKKAVIIDAVDAGRPPGTVYRFVPNQVISTRSDRSCSLHQGDVLQYVKLAEVLGMAPVEVVLIGVQPQSLSAGRKLSPAVAAAVPEAAAMALAEAALTQRDSAVYCRMKGQPALERPEIMRLSRKSEYACLAMIDLAEHYGAEPVNMTDLAKRKRIPKKYLEQILLMLKRTGYVKSTRGPGGGYGLARPPQRISLAEIIRLMDGALAPVESVSKYFYEHTPVEANKKLTRIFKDIRDYAASKLEQTYLSDLF